MSEKVGKSAVKLSPVPRRASLAETVYEKILALIISPKTPPGSRLSVDALGRDLKVSQTPIRQALVRLQAQGLVVKAQNVGYSTAPLPSAKVYKDIFQFRLLVEPEVARMAAENMSKKDVSKLEVLMARMEDPVQKELNLRYGQFAVDDGKFHMWIAEKAGNSITTHALEQLHTHTHLFRLRNHHTVTEEAIVEHRAIFNAVIKRKALLARDAMFNHIEASFKRMVPYFGE
ncbi:GntR family transcriptional regulator [Granulosicoccus antarcticus]|nr:GntR family transcriptional regulator [Granulosicoccus antarcticus]